MPRFVLHARFAVSADSLQEAKDILEQVIEHGKLMHGDVDWEWVNQPKGER